MLHSLAAAAQIKGNFDGGDFSRVSYSGKINSLCRWYHGDFKYSERHSDSARIDQAFLDPVFG